MAYVLGFIAADGSLIKNKRGAYFIDIQSIDKEIIYKIRDVFKSDIKIGEYQPKYENPNKRYRLQIGSKEIFKDLLRLGITPQKSKTIKLPNIPDKYFSHFLRGYFDGDGSVNICTYKRKDRKKPATVINCGFVSGSKDILEKIKNKLAKINIIKGGTLYFHDRGYRLWFSINDSWRLYKFMYNTSNDLSLNRKKEIFEKYFKK